MINTKIIKVKIIKGCYKQYGQTCEWWCIPIPNTGRRIYAGGEDDIFTLTHNRMVDYTCMTL